MLMTVSIERRSRTYHKPGCHYEKRIQPQYRMHMGPNKAESYGYRECKYCGGLQGYVRVYGKNEQYIDPKNTIRCSYDNKTDTMYVRTDIGFWKLFWKKRDKKSGYVLYHLNEYDPDADTERLKHGKYHRQSDVQMSDSIDKLLHYIEAHDHAKKIIADDYRKLPKNTKMEKYYYEVARKKEKRKQRQRMDQIFDLIASGADNRAILAI